MPIKIKITPKTKDNNEPEQVKKIKVTPKIKPILETNMPSKFITGQDLSEYNHEQLYVSFDIGIINLAYCILHESGQILDWGLVNMADGNTKLTCSHKLTSGQNKGKTCTTKAHYVHSDNSRKGLCKVHHRNHIDKQDYVRNMTVDNCSEMELKLKLFQALPKIPGLLQSSNVLIENQPIKAREKIKGIAHSIFDYCVLRSLDQSDVNFNYIGFVDAGNKLTMYDGPPVSCHLKTQYARNKWYGKYYCEYFLGTKKSDQKAALRYYSTHSKKDDLADSYLQGLWYINYGRHGLKVAVSQEHQTLVNKESNTLKYQRVRARAPAKKSKDRGRLTIASLKYLVNQAKRTGKAQRQDLENNELLKKNIVFYFSSIDEFLKII